MLELMLNSSGVVTMELKPRTYTGVAPSGFVPFSHPTILDPVRKRLLLLGYSDAKLYSLDLDTLTFSVPTTSSPVGGMRYGTRFTQASLAGGAALKYGISNTTGSFAPNMYYVNSSLGFYTASTWTSNTQYHNQVVVGDDVYFFGGSYGYTTFASNTMAVYKWYLNSTALAAHGTVASGMPPLTYNGVLGTDGTDIYMFGGITSTSSGNASTSDVYKYTLASKSWSKIGTTPFIMSTGLNTPYYAGKFWFLGATTTNGALWCKQLWSYTVTSGTWKLEATYPELENYRTGLLFLYGKTLYYFFPQLGGASSDKIFTIRLG